MNDGSIKSFKDGILNKQKLKQLLHNSLSSNLNINNITQDALDNEDMMLYASIES